MNKYYITYYWNSPGDGSYSNGVTGFIHFYCLDQMSGEDIIELLEKECIINIKKRTTMKVVNVTVINWKEVL